MKQGVNGRLPVLILDAQWPVSLVYVVMPLYRSFPFTLEFLFIFMVSAIVIALPSVCWEESDEASIYADDE